MHNEDNAAATSLSAVNSSAPLSGSTGGKAFRPSRIATTDKLMNDRISDALAITIFY